MRTTAPAISDTCARLAIKRGERDHPWGRPALRSSDPKVRARVQAFFDAHLGLLELVAGPMPLAVRASLAQAADALEFSVSAPDEEARRIAAQAALDALQGAARLGSAQRAVNRSAKKPGH